MPGSNTSQILTAAKQAIAESDFTVAKHLLVPLASDGVADAEYLLGMLYGEGDDETTYDQAREWLRRAAERDHADACYKLSTMRCSDSTGSTQHLGSLRDQLLRAARLGSVDAWHALGVYHAVGECDIPIDLSASREWYLRAAEAGHAYSQYNVGTMLFWGEGGEKDTNRGLHFLEAAAEQGEYDACRVLTYIFEGTWGLPPDPDKAKRYRAQAERLGPPP